jgi:hypothetical protein
MAMDALALEEIAAASPGWVYVESTVVMAEMMFWLHRVTPRFSLPSYSSVHEYGAHHRNLKLVVPPADEAHLE